jgi:fused signal recognition particle receptor
MFGFLKDKIKSWLGKSKDEVEQKAEKKSKEEVKIKPKAQKKNSKKEEKIEVVQKAKKEPKKVRTKEELRVERQITEEIIEDISKEGQEIKTPEEETEDFLDKATKEKEEQEIREVEEIREKKEEKEEKKSGFFNRFKKIFTYSLSQERFDEIFSELEMLLLESNVALEVIDNLKESLAKELVGKEMKKDSIEEEIKDALKSSIETILINPEDIISKIKNHRKNSKEPFVILFFGINGAGKTTSIAKFANLCLKNKLSCTLAAADTFRAAAIEQISIHAQRLGVNLIKQDYGGDPSAVAFDAIKYAKSNNIDVVLIDTAGRMHTKENLLHEMEKICRVTKPNLKVFVAEAIAGNDATEQAKAFNELIGIDGSILSKTDVDEKGGTIISIGFITKKPILYLGTGQTYNDLELFDKDKFIERLGL